MSNVAIYFVQTINFCCHCHMCILKMLNLLIDQSGLVWWINNVFLLITLNKCHSVIIHMVHSHFNNQLPRWTGLNSTSGFFYHANATLGITISDSQLLHCDYWMGCQEIWYSHFMVLRGWINYGIILNYDVEHGEHTLHTDVYISIVNVFFLYDVSN